MISPDAPMPVFRAWTLQRWSKMTFLHWRCDAAILEPLLPKGLSLDACEGSAWVGLLAFEVKDLRQPFMPAVPWISSFPEMNLRTYVRGPDGTRGVWLFSLDADRLAAVIGARVGFGLPYYWAKMSITQTPDSVEYVSQRYRSEAAAHISIALRDMFAAVELTPLDHFLTARYRIYTTFLGKLSYIQAEHPAWILQRAKIISLTETVRAHHAVFSRGEPIVHYSAGIDVRVSRVQFV